MLLLALKCAGSIPVGPDNQNGAGQSDWDGPKHNDGAEYLRGLLWGGPERSHASTQEPTDLLGDSPWEVPARRKAVLFIPPFSGVRLQARLTDREILDPLEVLCPRNTHGSWVPAWLAKVPSVPIVDAAVAKCGIENLVLPPPRGVEVRFEDSFDASMFLDQDRKARPAATRTGTEPRESTPPTETCPVSTG